MKEASYIVNGFEFFSLEDAELAEEEKKKIALIKQKANFNDKAFTIDLYKKLIKDKTFKTPIGYSFLIEMRDFLIKKHGADLQELKHIPVSKITITDTVIKESKPNKIFENKGTRRIKKIDNLREKLKISYIVIGFLIATIMVMFYITVTNENVGYINTEQKILNKYASWEEQLQEKEARLLEREQKLQNN